MYARTAASSATAIFMLTTPATALDIALLGGSQSLDRSEILVSGEGKATEQTLRLHMFLGDDKITAIGLYGYSADYSITKDMTEDEVLYKQDGFFTASGTGLDFIIQAPFDWVQPYLRLGYVISNYDYQITASTNYTSTSGVNLLTEMESHLKFAGRGLEGGAGIRIGQEYGLLIEYSERRETLTINYATLAFANYADGVQDQINSGVAAMINDFRKLFGQKMMHSSQTLHIGVDYRF